jgi:hypothetical protein
MLAYLGIGAICLLVGAALGVLWGRKHPALVATVVNTAQKL